MPWSSPSTRASLYSVQHADWNELVNDLLFLREIGYAQITAPVAVTSTTVATATQIVTLGSITYEAVPTMIQFYSPRILSSVATHSYAVLRDGSTVLGTLVDMSASTGVAVYAETRLTPTAAAHSYNVAVWNASAGTTNVNAGSGGAAGDGTTYLPCYIRAVRIPT
jgi:hypothetical protein